MTPGTWNERNTQMSLTDSTDTIAMRTPMNAEQAAALSPRLRYMMGCNANAPVRG